MTSSVDIYSSDSRRRPVYHTSVSSLSGLAVCSAFCQQSADTLISAQLTDPINQTTGVDVVEYVTGRGPRPSTVPVSCVLWDKQCLINRAHVHV